MFYPIRYEFLQNTQFLKYSIAELPLLIIIQFLHKFGSRCFSYFLRVWILFLLKLSTEMKAEPCFCVCIWCFRALLPVTLLRKSSWEAVVLRRSVFTCRKRKIFSFSAQIIKAATASVCTRAVWANNPATRNFFFFDRSSQRETHNVCVASNR